MIKYDHLLGCPFEWGVNDCRTLAQSFYKDNFGIEFPEFEIPNDWDNGKPNIMIKELITRGFELIDYNSFKTRIADLYVCAFFNEYPNHLMIDVGNNKVLHHIEGGVSKTANFSGLLKSNLCATFRYPGITLEEERVEMINILDDAPYQVRRAFDVG